MVEFRLMHGENRLDARWLRRWTLRLGIAALLVLAFPAFTVVALISIIGIPLGIAMMATPFLFIVIALANVVQRLLRRDGGGAVAASLAASLLLLAGVGTLSNWTLDRRADAFLTGDVDELEKPFLAKHVGLVSLDFRGWSASDAHCDELCQRLLLSGAAERVVVADLKPGVIEWSAGTAARTYRMEQRPSCPPIRVRASRSIRAWDEARSDETMRMVIAGGRCLVEEYGTLGDADAVLTTGRVHRGMSDFTAGLSLLADTVTAHRASVHVREPGGFVEHYRSTTVRILYHPLVPVPTLVGGHELNMQPGFLRMEVTRNSRDFVNDDLDALAFARGELGLDVTIPPATTKSRAALITGALDRPGPLQPPTQQVIDDFFLYFVTGRIQKLDEDTRRLAFRILADTRVVAPRETWAVVRGVSDAGEGVNAELAGILFAKLDSTDPALRDADPSYLGYPASYVANAIAMLPPSSMLPYRRELEELARDPVRRRPAVQALAQLSAFGSDAVPTLLSLVETGCALKEAAEDSRSTRRANPEDWQKVYHAGLMGLCRLGSEAEAALPPLLERLRNGTLPVAGATRELLLTTLIRLGVDPAQIRDQLARDTTPASEKQFDRLVERARSKPNCD